MGFVFEENGERSALIPWYETVIESKSADRFSL